MLVDFELAAMNAIANVMPQVTVAGCFFHLSSNLWKKIQALNLSARYIVAPEFALCLRIIPAIAFVSPVNVNNAFHTVANIIR